MPWGDCCDVLSRLNVCSDEFSAVMDEAAGKRAHDRWLIPWADESATTDYVIERHGLDTGSTDPNQVNRRMRLALKAARLPAYTPHQLRHSFVTNMLRCGVPLHLVQKLANHSSPAVTSRYIKAGGQELREWLGGDGR